MSRKTCRLDKPYRQWIHTLPCLVCGARQGVESHHAGDDKGMALKPPDSTCIPLCPAHHRVGPDAWHDGCAKREGFERRHGIDVLAEIARLNREYEAMGAKLEQRKPKRRPAAKAAKRKSDQFRVLNDVRAMEDLRAIQSLRPVPMSERLRELREGKASRKA